jgi:hypothetical protein
MHQLQIEFPGQEKYWTDNNFVITEERSRRFIIGKMKNWERSQSRKDFEAKVGIKYASSLPELDPNDEIPPITVEDKKGFPITHVYLDGTPFDGSRLQKK